MTQKRVTVTFEIAENQVENLRDELFRVRIELANGDVIRPEVIHIREES
jgi:hypothetical protein